MKWIVLLLLLALNEDMQAAPPGPDRADRWILERDAGMAGDTSKKVNWCDWWSAVAIYGVAGNLKGRPRKIKWEKVGKDDFPLDALYVVDNEDDTPHERAFIESILFEGWDWAEREDKTKVSGMPAEYVKSMLMDSCMNGRAM